MVTDFHNGCDFISTGQGLFINNIVDFIKMLGIGFRAQLLGAYFGHLFVWVPILETYFAWVLQGGF